MIRDPRPPEPVTAAKQEEARRVGAKMNAAIELSQRDGIDLGEALVLLERAPDAAEQLAGLGSMTLDQLCAEPDSSEHNYDYGELEVVPSDAPGLYGDVLLALMAERRATRHETEDWLVSRFAAAGERREPRHAAPGEGLQLPEEVTLAAALEGSGVSIGRVMMLAAEHEQARTLAAPSKGMVKRDIDDWGEVKLEFGADLDALLSDPLAVRRDYRRARELELVADDGGVELDDENEDFKRFEQGWRSYVNRGLDFVATLELREGERQAELERQRQVGEIERGVQAERLAAARKQRELAADLVEQAKRLEAM